MSVSGCLRLLIVGLGALWRSSAANKFTTELNVPDYEIESLHDLYDAANGDWWVWSDDGNVWDFAVPEPNPCKDSWQGITCTTHPEGGYLHITGLQLPSYNLSGTLPSSLGNLAQLYALDLSSNELRGPIPESLGNCLQLVVLDLELNLLTGPIPHSLGHCTGLYKVLLAQNLLTGSISSSVGNCANLTIVDLYNNQLTGTIPAALGQCTQLRQLYINYNSLSGTFPASLGQCTGLTHIYVDDNYLTGSIPASLGNVTPLIYLSAFNNWLSGTLPSSLGQLTRLLEMNLYDNRLSGAIPTAIGQCTKLVTLSLDYNYLTGSIPATIGNHRDLVSLDLKVNRLTGPLPIALHNCTGLRYLSLQENLLTGAIPEELGQLAIVRILALDRNLLTGTLSGNVLGGVNHSVVVFQGNNNFFTGTLPTILTAEALQLVKLDVTSNRLQGTIPQFLATSLSRIQQLGLSYNRFTGTIPSSWMIFTVVYLDLQSNQLHGTIPASLGQLPALQYLNLSNNQLTGPLPVSFQQLHALQTLTLKNNQLNGNLGSVFSATSQRNLSVIQLTGNQLTGTLPDEVFRLPRLSSFAAVGNCFDGPLPVEAICGSTALTSLVLDGLHSAAACAAHRTNLNPAFTLGTLPACLFTMPRLATLHLSGTGLTGTLPTVDASPGLMDLSLSHNTLTGPIPRAFLERDWDKLDLSFNRLTGTLHNPKDAPYNGSTDLYLQHNRLSGEIPGSLQRVGSLSLLEANLFSCRLDRSDLPHQDADSGKYTCGSDSVNNALYAWLAVAVTLVVAVVIFAYHTDDWTLTRELRMAIGAPLPSLGVLCALYSVLVLSPLYVITTAKADPHAIYTFQYAWTVSGAYQSGQSAFISEWVFLSLLLLLCWWWAGWVLPREDAVVAAGSQGVEADASHRAVSQSSVLLVLLSLVVVIGTNVAFVYATLRLDGRTLAVVQVLLAVFKLGFNHLVVPVLRRRLQAAVASSGSVFDGLQLGLSVFNVVVVPCLVAVLISPNCLYAALAGMNTVTSTYSYPGSCAKNNFIVVDDEVTSTGCTAYYTETDGTTYTPSFAYSYQCSASFVTYYAPTFVIMGLISAFLMPIQRRLLVWLRRHLPATSHAHSIVTFCTPRILRELPSSEQVAMYRADPQRPPIWDPNQILSVQVTFLSLSLSFGALFPPLAVCCAGAIVSIELTARLELAQYLTRAQAEDRQDCIEELKVACTGAALPSQLRRVLFLLLALCCVFYAPFLFDTLGDAQGLSGAVWVLVVVPLLPLVSLLCATVWRACLTSVSLTSAAASDISVFGPLGYETELPAVKDMTTVNPLV